MDGETKKGVEMSKVYKYYWGVRVSEVISYKDLMLSSDSVDVVDGNLLFKNDEGFVLFCIARGDWLCFYAASCIDGCPVCVEHWDPVERDGDD